MTAYYEEIMELWKARKFSDAISYFSQWIPKGLVSQGEIDAPVGMRIVDWINSWK
ncbi:MAG: hypothetical protein ABSH06_32110 [Thermodesulfobacteriota bacterium]|jgi:hypothetical protein